MKAIGILLALAIMVLAGAGIGDNAGEHSITTSPTAAQETYYHPEIFAEEPTYASSVLTNPAPRPKRETYAGYDVIARDGDDICLLINCVPTWVTITHDDGCNPGVDWGAFDNMLEELDGAFMHSVG